MLWGLRVRQTGEHERFSGGKVELQDRGTISWILDRLRFRHINSGYI